MPLNITSSSESLGSGLQLVARALSTRSAVPALAGVMLEAEGNQLIARGTDLEIAISVRLDAEIKEPGSVLLPGRLLLDIIRALPSGEVALSERSEQQDVEIVTGSSQFHLRTLGRDDFPRLPRFEEAALSIPGEAFAATIERVATAASRDEVRPILTGILVQAEEKTLTMVATDSYRLSVKHTELSDAVPESLEANVPARGLRELARIVSQGEIESVEVAPAGSQIVFRAGTTVLSSRLIEGQFPSHRQLIPETFEYEVKLPREELGDVTRRVRHLAQRNAPIRLAFAEGELTVAAETPDIGDAAESMPASFTGDPLEIAFNPQFLVEGIESVETEEIVLQLTSPLRPGLLRPVGADDFTYLVMPIRLND